MIDIQEVSEQVHANARNAETANSLSANFTKIVENSNLQMLELLNKSRCYTVFYRI